MLTAKYCNTYTKIAVVKARHGPHKFLLHTIPLMNDVGGRHVKVTILYIGATIKHCFLFIRVCIYFLFILYKKDSLLYLNMYDMYDIYYYYPRNIKKKNWNKYGQVYKQMLKKKKWRKF